MVAAHECECTKPDLRSRLQLVHSLGDAKSFDLAVYHCRLFHGSHFPRNTRAARHDTTSLNSVQAAADLEERVENDTAGVECAEVVRGVGHDDDRVKRRAVAPLPLARAELIYRVV